MKTLPSLKLLLEYLQYDAITGILVWKKSPLEPLKIGSRAGSICQTTGHRQIRFQRSTYAEHRIAWLMHYGEQPKQVIDHINRVRDDNRISNLRDVSVRENSLNASRRSSARAKAGARGITWHKQTQKWQVTICLFNKTKYIGLFENEDLAQAAYWRAVEAYNHSPTASVAAE